MVFLTGKAGTGKTTFLKYLRATTEKKTVVLAPTGVAAINAGGQTIHSFFNIPLGLFHPNDDRFRERAIQGDVDKRTIYDHFQYRADKLELINEMELLVIDEVSMVRCDLLDVIDRLLRVFRKRRAIPFGGVQVVLIGDVFQLPPVVRNEDWAILNNFYSSPFFFSSKVIENNKPVYIELKKIYRQKEQDFINLLNLVRINEIRDSDLQVLNKRCNPKFVPRNEDNYITLGTRNIQVDALNHEKLETLTGPLYESTAQVSGIFPENTFPTDRVLHVKVGVQIMFIKNDPDRRFYNGKIAKVVRIDDEGVFINLGGENEVQLERQVWKNVRYTWNEELKKIEEETIGSFSQFPIKLAWAITVHKSQGLTFERVVADLGGAFASGQVYVALSRCTSLNGLVLKSQINRADIRTDPRVIEFAKNETPSTMIVKELTDGKADMYYMRARNDIRQRNFSGAYTNLIRAISLRNDIESENFKRYFIVFAERLHYKSNSKQVTTDSQRTSSETLQEETKEVAKSKIRESLSENARAFVEKFISSNKEASLIKERDMAMKENEKLKSEMAVLTEELRNQRQKVFELKSIIHKNESQINELKQRKWYQLLFDKYRMK
jgi:sulfur transfer complex TusBCD TusB component (DsrH family)